MATPKSEARTRAWLERNGFYAVRAAGSLGLFDLVGLRTDSLLLIQAKCNQGPRKDEYEKLRGFTNYPSSGKKLVFIWKAWQRDPIIKEVPSVA